MKYWIALVGVVLAGCSFQVTVDPRPMDTAAATAMLSNPQMSRFVRALHDSGAASTPDELIRFTGYYQVWCDAYAGGGWEGAGMQYYGKVAAPGMKHDAAVTLNKDITMDQAQALVDAFAATCHRPSRTG